MDSADGGDRSPDLNRVRRDLARLGTDADSAPEVPAEVTARVGAALRAASRPPAHSARQAPRRRRLLAAVLGLGAAVVGVALGALMLGRGPSPAPSAGPTAKQITVSRPASALPLSTAQILGLLDRPPDYGPVADPRRRESCLSALGYPETTPVLGAEPLELDGRAGVLLLLPGETPETLAALVVGPNCSAVGSELLADTVIARP
jgi:hypothetical protein